ncbi:hypothetical protein N9B48_00190 [bacterium]|nr:hypothetical protein [bacterium]
MFRFVASPGWFGFLFLFVVGIGLPNAAMAVPQDLFDPVADELVRIYVDELTNCDCDYLVVAVLEGAPSSEKSKEGVVINMFPPGNTGTRAKNTGGTGSGDSKSGAQDHNTTRSNRHTRLGDTGGGTGTGDGKSGAQDHNTTRSNRHTRLGDSGGGTGSGDSKSGAQDHNTTRSNRHTRLGDTGGGTGSGDADIRECEHCNASCTERCQCKPTGMDLIFGHNDDMLLAMESDTDGAYLAFETCYGMRSVTLTSMGKNLNLTLVIAKGWRAESLNR